MSRKKADPKRMKRLKNALGIAGVSLSLAGGASAMPVSSGALHVLHEEEIADVSLVTFRLFDLEGDDTTAKSAGTGTGTGTGAAANAGSGITQAHCRASCNGCARCRAYCRACAAQ
jgi:hypothetical protein